MESSTKILRRLLDERGVEWGDDGYPTTCTVWVSDGVTWHGLWRDDCIELIAHLTPEQAIAATLGRGECHMEQTGHVKVAGVDYYDDDYECSECGAEIFEGYNFCPNCGRKVVDDG